MGTLLIIKGGASFKDNAIESLKLQGEEIEFTDNENVVGLNLKIESTGKLSTNGNCYLLKVKAGETYRIICNSENKNAVVTVIKNQTLINKDTTQTIEYASGFNGTISISPTVLTGYELSPYDIRIPSDGVNMYIFRGSGASNPNLPRVLKLS